MIFRSLPIAATPYVYYIYMHICVEEERVRERERERERASAVREGAAASYVLTYVMYMCIH